jgi:hypothetical protein
VAQQFGSLPERERPQRGLAPAASLRRKVAMKNDQEREREQWQWRAVKEVVVAMGSGMAHRKEAVVAWSCNAERGKWRWRRPDTKETEGTGETGAHDFF